MSYRRMVSCLLVLGALVAAGLPVPTATAATTRFREIDERSKITHDGALYFFANDGMHGKELWTTNGTAAGTRLVFDSRPGNEASHTRYTTIVSTAQGLVLLGGPDPIVRVRAAGSGYAAAPATDPYLVGDRRYLATVGSRVLVVANSNNRLLALDPASNVVSAVGEHYRVDAASAAVVSGVAYFAATTVTGTNIRPTVWRSDGTAGGTRQALELPGYDPTTFVATSNRVFFTAQRFGRQEFQLWTLGVAAAKPALLASHRGRTFTPVGKRLYWVQWPGDQSQGSMLWTTNGVTTKRLTRTGTIGDLAAVGPRLAYLRDGGLWFTNATAKGTVRTLRSGGTTILSVDQARQQVYLSANIFPRIGDVWQSRRYVGSTKNLGALGRPVWPIGSVLVSTRVPADGFYHLVFNRITVRKPVIKATKKPAIRGTAKAGKTLTLNRGKWTPSSATLTWQWYVNGTKVKGATTSTFRISSARKGKKITVKVLAKAPGAKSVTVTTKAVKVAR